MEIVVGCVVFAVGIIISIALHEAGHMWSAKAFGMKVTRYFIGFGPTLFSFRRGVTEYGVKAIPAGAFVKIVGMTPQDDDVAPEDEKRAMWRYPVWKRTIVMAAGSIMHFALGIAILWSIFAFLPLNDYDKVPESTAVVDEVSPCITLAFKVDPATGQQVTCKEGVDPPSPARAAGLERGDKIVAINGVATPTWTAFTDAIRGAGGTSTTITYERDGVERTSPAVAIPLTERIKQSVGVKPAKEVTAADLEKVGQVGVAPMAPKVVAGPGAAFGLAIDRTGMLVGLTVDAMKQFPEKIPKLWHAITGSERDPETPVSMVGATRIGGELWERGDVASFLGLLVSLNFFVGLFNLLPLLPLDGGHIAIAWFERVRSWLYARLRRPEPGRIDYMKLMPVTYVVILIFGGFTVLTLAADIINPITLPK
jgi:membrane-associated protease RseP (regulator of RpoE activity)